MTDQTITLLPLDAIVASTINPRDRFAFAAYRMADAMLRARDMSPKPETENTSDEHVGGENT